MGETVQMTDFSSETMQARRKWHISQVLKENNCQHKALYPVKTSFWNGREIKTFSDERKLREYVTGILNLKRMAEGSSEKRKEMIKKKKKESWDIRKEERTIQSIKVWVSTIDFSSPFEFSKFCLTVQQKF